MPKINILSKEVSELISAGEVVERPASAIKEIVENSVDADSKKITVEIKGGGIQYMRVTDNGCGIARNDVKTAFLRHATSKISNQNDLNSISTLGFRGEALAAISSVCKVDIITKTEDEETGTHYSIEGSEEKAFEDVGCDNGTTLIIRDIFFNTPARMKFLKKDVTEGNAVSAVVERIALSHPEISFKFIRDGKTVFNTSGDGKLMSAIYNVLGREFSLSLIEVNSLENRISVNGYICKPTYCKATRNGQYFFLNGRLVKSNTCMAALEQAYKNSSMIGKFPSCVLNITVPFDTVDVNVHPSKTEVRFSNEKIIFDAVYYAVKNSLVSLDTRPQINLRPAVKFSAFEHIDTDKYKQEVIKEKDVTLAEKIYFEMPQESTYIRLNDVSTVNEEKPCQISFDDKIKSTEPKKEETATTYETEIIGKVKYIGEAFMTYIIAEYGDSVFLIDKHAAHERIIFEKLKKTEIPQTQEMLLPVTVKLKPSDYNAVLSNSELLTKAGFEVENFGSSTVIVRGIPVSLKNEDVENLMLEIAENLAEKGVVQSEKLDKIFHTVACKAAIKGGNVTSDLEKTKLAERVLLNDDIRYCPHGRPVAFEIKKKDLEKQFGRIQ